MKDLLIEKLKSDYADDPNVKGYWSDEQVIEWTINKLVAMLRGEE